MEQEKLLTSFVVTNKVNIYKLGSDVIPYSGIYITQKSQFSLKVAFELLNEERFLNIYQMWELLQVEIHFELPQMI